MKQRGSMLVELIIYGVIAAVVMGAVYKAWSSFTDSYRNEGRVAQLAIDQPLIDTAKANEQSALASKDQAERDAVQAKEAASKQSAAIEAARKDTEAAQAAARKQAQLYAAERAKNADREAKLREAAAAPPRGGQPCEAVLKATDDILRESAVRRAQQ